MRGCVPRWNGCAVSQPSAIAGAPIAHRRACPYPALPAEPGLLSSFIFPALVVFVAAVVQGVTGFAFGIVSMVFLTLLWQPQQANVVVSLLGMYSLCHTVWGVRREIRWRSLGPLVIGNLLGLGLSLTVMVSPGLGDVLRGLVAL